MTERMSEREWRKGKVFKLIFAICCLVQFGWNIYVLIQKLCRFRCITHHRWSSNGNHVMSILHVDLKIPGGTYKQDPLLRTTTFVGYVPSKPSSALWVFFVFIVVHSSNRMFRFVLTMMRYITMMEEAIVWARVKDKSQKETVMMMKCRNLKIWVILLTSRRKCRAWFCCHLQIAIILYFLWTLSFQFASVQ